jgi:hypothetical protein
VQSINGLPRPWNAGDARTSDDETVGAGVLLRLAEELSVEVADSVAVGDGVTAALCVLLAVAPLEPDVEALAVPDCVCTVTSARANRIEVEVAPVCAQPRSQSTQEAEARDPVARRFSCVSVSPTPGRRRGGAATATPNAPRCSWK